MSRDSTARAIAKTIKLLESVDPEQIYVLNTTVGGPIDNQVTVRIHIELRSKADNEALR